MPPVSGLTFVADQDKWDLRTIPTADIREGAEALRDVDRGDAQYIELRDSIGQKGLLLPLLVREMKDKVTGKVTFQIVDGLQRFTAMSELGAKNIPANVVDLTEAEVFEAQLIANAKRVQTKPAQFASHLLKILGQNPLLTRQELADKVAVSKAWIDSHLHLGKLAPGIAELVDENKIVVSNALAMAKLPAEEQLELVDLAQTELAGTFAARCEKRLKEIREAARTGRDPSREWTPTASPRKTAAIKSEFESPKAGPLIVSKGQVDTAEEGFALGVAWVLQMDPISIEIQRSQEEDRKTRQKREAERRKQERDELAEALAQKRAAELQPA